MRKFTLAVLLLIAFAAIRSLIATRLDAFTIDEPYHITSGVAYVTRGDFRLNPEHPPLVKLWAGGAVAPMYHLPPFRKLESKIDEREFHESTMFLRNDADAVQRRARMAMVALHMLLLAAFAFAARPLVGDAAALGALLFLAIDPTVAAHMPVVMTDLPIALLSAIAVLAAALAFRTWRPAHLVTASIASGLALGAKHNGIIAVIVIAILGITAVMRGERRWQRTGAVIAVLAGSVVVLWALYGFQFYETAANVETYNEPLAAKIRALHHPWFRDVLQWITRAHVLPRAYVWGLADVLRAGVEGRAYPFTFFGRTFIGHTPWFFFPAAVAVKVPLGLLALALAAFAFPSRLRAARPLLLFAAIYLLTLMTSNSGYAGVRHALPLFPPLAALCGITLAGMWESRRAIPLAFSSACVVAAVVAAIPVLRPWEFFNTIGGGTKEAFRNFSDEGTDLGQRAGEIAAFYRSHIARSGLPAYDAYGLLQRDTERRRMDVVGFFDPVPIESDRLSGWFLVGAGGLGVDAPWTDFEAFRRAKPVARFGNVMVYRGTFDVPWMRALHNYVSAMVLMYSPRADLVKAESMVADAAARNPRAYPILITLGNVRTKLGRRDDAIRAFLAARRHVLPDDPFLAEIDAHVARLRREPLRQVGSLKNPWAE